MASGPGSNKAGGPGSAEVAASRGPFEPWAARVTVQPTGSPGPRLAAPWLSGRKPSAPWNSGGRAMKAPAMAGTWAMVRPRRRAPTPGGAPGRWMA